MCLTGREYTEKGRGEDSGGCESLREMRKMVVRKTTTEQDCQRKEANVMKEVKETKEQTEVEKIKRGGET